MGFRSNLQIPHPSPSDLDEPAQGFNPETLQQLMALDEPIENIPHMNRAPAAQTLDEEILGTINAADPLDAEIMQTIAGNPPAQRTDISPVTQEVVNKMYERGFLKNLQDRIAVKTGRNSSEQLSLLKKRFPDSYIEEKDGNFYVDGEQFDPVFAPEGKGWQELGLDIADFVPDIAEGTIAFLTELGLLAGGPATGGLSLLGAMAGGSAAGQGARRGAVSLLGGTPMSPQEEGENLALSTALNFGIGSALGKLGGISRRSLDTTSREARMKFIKEHMDGINNVYKNLEPALTPEEVLSKSRSIVQNEQKRLGNEIEFFKEELSKLPGNKNLVPMDFMDSLSDAIIKGGGTIDQETGKALLPANIKAIDPWGSPNGREALKDLVGRYNSIKDAIDHGGFKIENFFNWADSFKTMDAPTGKFPFNPGKDAKLKSVYEAIHVAAAKDRDIQAKMLIDKHPSYFSKETVDRFNGAFSNYRSKIDAIKSIKDAMLNNPSAVKAIDEIIATVDPNKIATVKALFNDTPEIWDMLASNWLYGKFQKHLGPATGRFEADAFLKEFAESKLPKASRELILDENKLALIKAHARELASIPKDKLFTRPEYESRLLNALKGLWGFNPKTFAMAMFDYTGGNAVLADKLFNDSLANMIKTERNPALKNNLIKAYQVGQTMMNNSATVGTGPTRKFILTPAARRMLLNMLPNGKIVETGNQMFGVGPAPIDSINRDLTSEDMEFNLDAPVEEF